MPYTPTAWVLSGAPAINAINLNNLETQYTESTNSFPLDLVTNFTYSGFGCVKDGSIATQLDVAAGVIYIGQTDGTKRKRQLGATNQSTVGHPSATLFLDINPDASWSFATTHSGVTNSMPICSVTTDGSANISTVTDARISVVNLFPSAIGAPQFGGVNLAKMNTAGGGAAAGTIWVGTTDPGGLAAEGDLWVGN